MRKADFPALVYESEFPRFTTSCVRCHSLKSLLIICVRVYSQSWVQLQQKCGSHRVGPITTSVVAIGWVQLQQKCGSHWVGPITTKVW